MRTALGVILLFVVGSAHAAVVSTLPQTAINFTGVGGTNDYAAGFVWNSTSDFASADLYMGIEGNPSADLTVSLYDDISGSPGALILALLGANPTTAGLYSYTGTTSLTFGNTYWLVASTGVYGDVENEYIWYDGTLGDSNYVATQWRSPPETVSWFTSAIVSPAAFAVHAVPIPAAVWLFGSGIGLLGWFRRRQSA